MSETKPIVVSGAHRSGSTWVGQVLSQAPGNGYLHEPFNPIYANPKSVIIDRWMLHLHEQSSPEYKSHFVDVLNWKFKGMSRLPKINSWFQAKMWLKYFYIFARNRFLDNRVIFKDPIAFFSLPWLYNNFDLEILILVRHPAAFAYSLKRKNWRFPFHHLIQQEVLMETYLRDFQSEIVQYAEVQKDIVSQATLIWRIIYSTCAEYQKEFPEWLIMRHEDISRRPTAMFQSIFKAFDLDFTDEVRNFIADTTGKENASGTSGGEENLKRNSAENTKYWKNKLTGSELEHIKKSTDGIWQKFYDEDDW